MFRLLAILSLVLFSVNSHAGFYLEPYLGYEMGSFKTDAVVTAPISTTVADDEDLTGLNYGIKLGWSVAVVVFGVDYMMGSQEGEENGVTSDYDSKDLGVFVRTDFPVFPVQFSATYFLSSEMEEAATATSSAALMKGGGLKLGASFTGLPLIAINLDMIANSYDEAEVTGLTFSSVDAKRSSYMLGVSVPFDF